MTGEADWFSNALAVGGVVSILVTGFLLSRVKRGVKAEWRALDCPPTGVTFDGLIVRDIQSGEVTGIERCSAFLEPCMPACDRECVAEINRKAKQEAARPVKIGG